MSFSPNSLVRTAFPFLECWFKPKLHSDNQSSKLLHQHREHIENIYETKHCPRMATTYVCSMAEAAVYQYHAKVFYGQFADVPWSGRNGQMYHSRNSRLAPGLMFNSGQKRSLKIGQIHGFWEIPKTISHLSRVSHKRMSWERRRAGVAIYESRYRVTDRLWETDGSFVGQFYAAP